MNTFDLIHSSLKIQNIILQLRKLLTKPSNRTFGSEIIYFYSIINIIWQLSNTLRMYKYLTSVKKTRVIKCAIIHITGALENATILARLQKNYVISL